MTTTTPPVAPAHKAIASYYADLDSYRAQRVTHELALKTAFQTLLAKLAQERKWTLIPELTLDNGKRPDGALLDGNGYTRGYWEAKDPGDALEWIVDQYQVSTDHRSGITSDPNRDGSDADRQYIARLVGKVTHVSVETVRLVNDLDARVDLLAALGIASSAPVASPAVVATPD